MDNKTLPFSLLLAYSKSKQKHTAMKSLFLLLLLSYSAGAQDSSLVADAEKIRLHLVNLKIDLARHDRYMVMRVDSHDAWISFHPATDSVPEGSVIYDFGTFQYLLRLDDTLQCLQCRDSGRFRPCIVPPSGTQFLLPLEISADPAGMILLCLVLPRGKPGRIVSFRIKADGKPED